MTYKTLAKLAKGRKTVPILGCVRIKDGIATTTDIEVYVHAPLNEDASRMDNAATYHAHGFEKGIFIKAEYPAEDFPELGDKGEVTGVTVIPADRMDAFKWVLQAASTEATRYYLNGIYFDPEGVVVATNGHRLHSFKQDIEWGYQTVQKPKKGKKKKADAKKPEPVKGGIIPSQACKIIIDLMKETKAQEVRIQFHENCKFTCTIGEVVVEGKLIDGTFPQWRKVCPKHPKKNHTLFDPAQIKAVLPELAVIAKISGTKTPALAVEKGKMTPSYNHTGSKPEWDVVMNLPFRAGFNAKYLSELCGGVMRYGDHTSPFIVEDRRGGIERLGVLMPMRV